jgi:hypothetical protein
MMMDIDTRETRYFEQWPGKDLDVAGLRAALEEGECLTFNGTKYDMPILALALTPHTMCADIKDASDRIILKNMPPWKFYKQHDVTPLDLNHVDICEPAPGVMVSLKSYAGRLHMPKMQDLPIEPNAEITPEQRVLLRTYCQNDLDVTAALYRKIEPQIDLRRQMSAQYGIDLRSKSDAQIAEAVIKHEVGKATGKEIERPVIAPGTKYRYKAPGFITFETPELKAMFAQVKAVEYVVAENGSIDIPQELADLKIKIGGSTYQMGIGGLHSTEKSVAHVADEECVLVDRDFASYYPSIILRCSLYPKHMGKGFLDVYADIVRERLDAKHRVKELKAEIERIEKELANEQ